VPTAPTGTQPPADAPKTFTQDDLDRILTDRLARQEKAFTDKFAQALGITDPNAVVDPAKALAEAQEATQAAYGLAHSSTAEALALAAGIKPDKVQDFVRLVDPKAVLKDVNPTDAAAVRAALNTAVAAKAASHPEWTGSALPAASGSDLQVQPNGKRIYSRAELKGMTQQDLRAIAGDLQLAASEGRITA